MMSGATQSGQPLGTAKDDNQHRSQAASRTNAMRTTATYLKAPNFLIVEIGKAA